MKKMFIIIISAVIICLTGLGLIGYFVEQNEKKEANEIKNEQSVNGENQWVVLEGDTLDINKIPGFKPGGTVVEKVENEENSNNNSNATNNETNNNDTDNTNTSDNKETDENNTNDSEEEKEKVTEVGGLELPWTPPYKEMEVIAIGGYTGEFVEDGSDTKKNNILSMVIRNTSDKIIDYGEILIKISGKSEVLSFKVSNLKPGASALVLVSNGETKFDENAKYTYLDSRNEFVDEMSLMSDDVTITTKDKEITVENISDKDLGTVYVYYKTISPGGCYLGGITYRAKFVKVNKEKTVTTDTLHFSKKNSEIIMVESVNE